MIIDNLRARNIAHFDQVAEPETRNLLEKISKLINFARKIAILHLVHIHRQQLASEMGDIRRFVSCLCVDMAEPAYEYAHPPPYHPTPRKYPHLEPFDRCDHLTYGITCSRAHIGLAVYSFSCCIILM